MDNKNEQQIGAATYVVERVFTKDTHQALVSQEQFDMAAHFMGENTKANGVNPAFRHSIFGGIVYCACCGAAMCSGGSVYNGEREKYWYLVCNNLTSRDSTLQAASLGRALTS